MKKCEFKKSNGERCGAEAQTGNRLCVFHNPETAAEGRRARRAGGVNRTRPVAVLRADTPDHPLGNSCEVSSLLADSINRLRRGELDPRVANGIGYLASILLRALEQGSIEERLAQLEAIVAKSDVGAEISNFRKEIVHEQPLAAAPQDDRGQSHAL